MLYVLIPHRAESSDDFRFFVTFGVAEQIIFTAARGYAATGADPDWCTLVAYYGTDELQPAFIYTIITVDRLRRDPFPSPSP